MSDVAKLLHHKIAAAVGDPYEDGDACPDCEESVREEFQPLIDAQISAAVAAFAEKAAATICVNCDTKQPLFTDGWIRHSRFDKDGKPEQLHCYAHAIRALSHDRSHLDAMLLEARDKILAAQLKALCLDVGLPVTSGWGDVVRRYRELESQLAAKGARNES